MLTFLDNYCEEEDEITDDHSSEKQSDEEDAHTSPPKPAVRKSGKGKAASVSNGQQDLKSWVITIGERSAVKPKILTRRSTYKSCSIFRVPHFLRRRDVNAYYTPHIISIGPFHHGNRKLEAMEEHKWSYMRDMFYPSRSKGPSNMKTDSAENCLKAIKKLEQKARSCYSEDLPKSETFAETMLLDGFFLINFFVRVPNENPSPVNENSPLQTSLTRKRFDPIVKFRWVRNTIRMDLLMLENQIPFFILVCLCDQLDIDKPKLMKRICSFFGFKDTTENNNLEYEHLLHLVHSLSLSQTNESSAGDASKPFLTCPCLFFSMQVTFQKKSEPEETKEEGKLIKKKIPNASTLKDSGIEFEKATDGSKIKFDNGVIKIPLLDKKNKFPVFLNLLAFEQCHRQAQLYYSGYTYFIDCLVDDANDVKILRESEILEPWLGNDQEVAVLFNNIGQDMYYCDSHLQDICTRINLYRKVRRYAWMSTFMKTYCGNPWAIISVVAAVILLLLTFTQTFFTAFPKFADGK